jgi:hypothetical protein
LRVATLYTSALALPVPFNIATSAQASNGTTLANTFLRKTLLEAFPFEARVCTVGLGIAYLT